MKAGAVDFLSKPLDEAELLAAIAGALARDGAQRNDRAEREVLAARFNRLTPREREVCALVAAGLLNKQVAGELGTSREDGEGPSGPRHGQARGRFRGGAGAPVRSGAPAGRRVRPPMGPWSDCARAIRWAWWLRSGCAPRAGPRGRRRSLCSESAEPSAPGGGLRRPRVRDGRRVSGSAPARAAGLSGRSTCGCPT